MTSKEPISIRRLFFCRLSPNFHLVISFSCFFLHYFGSTIIPSFLRYRPRYSEAADSTQLSDWLVESILLSRIRGTTLGTKEERSRKTLMKGGGLHRRRGTRKNIGERAGAEREKERISRIARRNFVAKLLYRLIIITERMVDYSTKDTARL